MSALSGDLMLISYTGCKSGKAYRQPVSYVRDGDVLLTPGGGRWTLNLADGRSARIRLRGRDAPARPELVLRQAGSAPAAVPHLMPRTPVPLFRGPARALATRCIRHRWNIAAAPAAPVEHGCRLPGRRGGPGPPGRGWRGACG